MCACSAMCKNICSMHHGVPRLPYITCMVHNAFMQCPTIACTLYIVWNYNISSHLLGCFMPFRIYLLINTFVNYCNVHQCSILWMCLWIHDGYHAMDSDLIFLGLNTSSRYCNMYFMLNSKTTEVNISVSNVKT